MVVVFASINVEGDEAATQPAAEATEEEAHEPCEGTVLGSDDGSGTLLAVRAHKFVGVHLESGLNASHA